MLIIVFSFFLLRQAYFLLELIFKGFEQTSNLIKLWCVACLEYFMRFLRRGVQLLL